MRTLLADILDDEAVPPIALAALPGVESFWSKVEIPGNLYPCHCWRGFSIVEFSAGQFAPAAADTLRSIRHYEPFSLIHYNERSFSSASCVQSGKCNNQTSGHEQKLTPRKGMT
jgi:hypothetical protein